MFEYQAELITRRRYNFEDSKFSLSADSDYCLDYPDIDEDGNWNVGDDVFIPISPDMTPIQVWDAIASQMW